MLRRLLADEHIPNSTISALREAGHDVVAASQEYRASPDRTLLAIGEREQRLLITFDRDFGVLLFAERVPQTTGVLFLRLMSQSHRSVTPALMPIVESSLEFLGYFTVIREDRVRSTILPDLRATP
jgi:predicted nuclease of predicted toxin-antitoxin system